MNTSPEEERGRAGRSRPLPAGQRGQEEETTALRTSVHGARAPSESGGGGAERAGLRSMKGGARSKRVGGEVSTADHQGHPERVSGRGLSASPRPCWKP